MSWVLFVVGKNAHDGFNEKLASLMLIYKELFGWVFQMHLV